MQMIFLESLWADLSNELYYPIGFTILICIKSKEVNH
jgi:hypothetical protein